MGRKRKFPEVIGVRLSTDSLEKLDQVIGVFGANSRSEFLRSKIENIIQSIFKNK
jgi:metal-responsive CopG/Arc/MetJ family transcriptional regulator